MKSYFECHLPKTVPSYYNPAIYGVLQEAVNKVYERTDKLNEACKKLGKTRHMRPATFHALAKKVFDVVSTQNDAERFDAMSVSELCKAVELLYNGEEYPDREEWPNAVVLYDTAFVSTKDWEALRHFGIGGSDTSVLMGYSPYQSKEGLWYEKTGYPELVEDGDRQAIFDRGHFIEPKVIEAFCWLTGATVVPETRMFCSKSNPHSTANIDAILRMPTGKLAVFEAKSAIDCYNKIGEWLGDNIPPYYMTQIFKYLAVMNDDRLEGAYIGMLPCTDHTIADMYIGSEIEPGKFYHHFVGRDVTYEQSLLSVESSFWQDYIETGKKPAPSKNAEIDKKVAQTYRPSPISDPTIQPTELDFKDYEELIEKLVSADEQVKSAKQQLERYEDYRESLRNEMIAAMSGAQVANLKDASGKIAFIVKNTLVKKDGVDVKSLKMGCPEIYQRFQKPSVYTKFFTKDVRTKT